MQFAIGLKLVKFQNGQFGIRRWTPFGHQFLDLHPSYDDYVYWWRTPEYIARYAAGSEEEARARLAEYRHPKPKLTALPSPGDDIGTPV